MKRLGFIIQKANQKQTQKHKPPAPTTRKSPGQICVSPKRNNSEAKPAKGPEPKQNTHTKTTRFAFDTGGSHRVVKNMHIETLLLLSAAQQTV